MLLENLPYVVLELIALHLKRAFYITTLGSACSAWRTIIQSNQRVLSNGLACGAGPCCSGSDAYAHYLSRFPSADTLRLTGAGLDLSAVTAPSLRELSVVLGTFVPSTFVAMSQLTSLELSTNRLGNTIATIAPRLGECVGLVKLAIRNNGIGLNATVVIAPVIARLTRLTDLDLSSNYIDHDCIEVLLPHLTSLTALLLSGNYINTADSRRALRSLTRLGTLDMGRQIPG